MFFHVQVGITGVTSWIETNLTREEALQRWICPFLSRELTFKDGRVYNMATVGSLIIYKTDRVIDSDWPIKKVEFEKGGGKLSWEYEDALRKYLKEKAEDVTQDICREGFVLLESGKWTDRLKSQYEKEKGRYCFFICPFDNSEVDHNYKFVIKPTIKQYQFEIQRVDEISHSKTINEVILASIAKARFIVADLTAARQNCYYELGYAHALGKPVILLAKKGTERHFDISTYQWNYWETYEDLLPVFERSVGAILSELGILPSRNSG